MRSCWNLRLSKLSFWFVVLSFKAIAQFSPAERPRFGTDGDKYIFPVNPGITGFLSGTMGELRNTHFHAGLDIRTNNMEGVPIRAAQRGYISRIILGSGGYGKVVFVTHPNGQTTLYAHLSALKGKYGDYARQQQYLRKSFEVDLTLTPDQLPVVQGDTIAFSGNTGGSNGAHLHFEIRDQNNEALNPMKFNFAELEDTHAPIAQKIALKTMNLDSRINDRFGRFEFYVYKIGDRYVFSQPIRAHGRIGVELLAHDIVDRYGYTCGINYIEMFADSQRIFSQTIEKINFYTTREILTVMDYKTMKNHGPLFNKLYIDDGNKLNYNDGSIQKGVVDVGETDVPVHIRLKDTYGNTSNVSFQLKSAPLSPEVKFVQPGKKALEYDLQENTMIITCGSCPSALPLTVYFQQEKQVLQPAYGNAFQKVYLVDLRTLLPDSVQSCNGILRFDYKDAIPSGTDYKFYGDFADILFQKDALYDTLYLNASKQEKDGREIFTIGTALVPLHQYISVTLKPSNLYSSDKSVGVYRVNGRETVYAGGTWENGRIRFYTQDLGSFTLLKDTIPPRLSRISLTRGGARFIIRDSMSGIASYNATVDGDWLLMNYDYKTGILQSERLDASKPLKGDFVLKVMDQAGNEKKFEQKIL
jgi:hypothetical protein